jgi:hypothetical protein
MQGVVTPNIDYPSFKWMGVQHIDFDEKVINRVPFKIVLVRVPSCKEEQSNDELEKLVYDFAKR